LAIAQQITGIDTVIDYAPTIFKFAGLPSTSVAILASIGVGVVNVVLTVVAMQLIDRGGKIVFDSADSFHYLALKDDDIYLVEQKMK
jgi:hypothetical protein